MKNLICFIFVFSFAMPQLHAELAAPEKNQKKTEYTLPKCEEWGLRVKELVVEKIVTDDRYCKIYTSATLKTQPEVFALCPLLIEDVLKVGIESLKSPSPSALCNLRKGDTLSGTVVKKKIVEEKVSSSGETIKVEHEAIILD